MMITVYDNASSYEHVKAVRSHRGAMVVSMPSNRMFYPVCNLAAASINNRRLYGRDVNYICFVANDTILADTALERLVREASKPHIGWVSAAYQQGNCWGHCVTEFPEAVLAELPDATDNLDLWARTLEPRAIGWNKTETTVFMVPAQQFLGFDEALGTGHHDIDYGIRLERAGLRMIVAYDAVVWHQLGSPTSRACVKDGSIVFTPMEVMDQYLLNKWGPEYRHWWEGMRPWQR